MGPALKRIRHRLMGVRYRVKGSPSEATLSVVAGTRRAENVGHVMVRNALRARPHVDTVSVDGNLKRRGLATELLERAIGMYPEGTEFTYLPAGDEGRLFMERFKDRHPEARFTIEDPRNA